LRNSFIILFMWHNCIHSHTRHVAALRCCMLHHTAQWLKPVVAGLSPRRPGCTSRAVRVGFVVNRVTLWQVFLKVLRLSPISVTPLELHSHSNIYRRRCVNWADDSAITYPAGTAVRPLSLYLHLRLSLYSDVPFSTNESFMLCSTSRVSVPCFAVLFYVVQYFQRFSTPLHGAVSVRKPWLPCPLKSYKSGVCVTPWGSAVWLNASKGSVYTADMGPKLFCSLHLWRSLGGETGVAAAAGGRVQGAAKWAAQCAL
jgi:hypothetical protein